MPATNDRERLRKKLLYHEEKAKSIRDVLEILQSEDEQKASRNGHSVLTEALEIDKARVKKSRVGQSYAKMAARRRRKTAKILKALSRTEPRRMRDARGASILLQHGYIERKDDGYVLTGKKFEA